MSRLPKISQWLRSIYQFSRFPSQWALAKPFEYRKLRPSVKRLPLRSFHHALVLHSRTHLAKGWHSKEQMLTKYYTGCSDCKLEKNDTLISRTEPIVCRSQLDRSFPAEFQELERDAQLGNLLRICDKKEEICGIEDATGDAIMKKTKFGINEDIDRYALQEAKATMMLAQLFSRCTNNCAVLAHSTKSMLERKKPKVQGCRGTSKTMKNKQSPSAQSIMGLIDSRKSSKSAKIQFQSLKVRNKLTKGYPQCATPKTPPTKNPSPISPDKPNNPNHRQIAPMKEVEVPIPGYHESPKKEVPPYRPFRTVEVPIIAPGPKYTKETTAKKASKTARAKAFKSKGDLKYDEFLKLKSPFSFREKKAKKAKKAEFETDVNDPDSRHLIRCTLLRALHRLETGTGHFSAKIVITNP